MERIGIDLGTTNSVASRGDEVLVVSADGKRSLPSVVAFLPNGHIQIGGLARRRRAIDSDNTIFSSKRIIGRRFDAHETRNFRDRYPFEIEELEGGWPAFRTRAGAKTPIEIATLILEALIERTQLSTDGVDVALTIPAAFAPSQRRASEEAAAKAGLGEVRLLEEPVATAHAYRSRGERFRRALVYDLGGGTFDCAVLDCTGDGSPTLLAHASDMMLGGDDIDQLLAEWVRRLVMEKHNWDLANYSEVRDRLLACSEDAKIQLSSLDTAEIEIAQIDPECPALDDVVTLTRGLLEAQCRTLLQRTFATCDAVLRAADLRPQDVDAVLLAGGTTWLPVVQQGVEAYFGRPGCMTIDPTQVVALGASHAEA